MWPFIAAMDRFLPMCKTLKLNIKYIRELIFLCHYSRFACLFNRGNAKKCNAWIKNIYIWIISKYVIKFKFFHVMSTKKINLESNARNFYHVSRKMEIIWKFLLWAMSKTPNNILRWCRYYFSFAVVGEYDILSHTLKTVIRSDSFNLVTTR